MPLRSFALGLVSVALVASCGAPRTPAPATVQGCVPPERTPDVVVFTIGQSVTLPTACPTVTATHFVGPLRLTAMDDGLHVQFDVADPTFRAGGVHDREIDRDRAVVYPSGEGPGRPSVELALDRTAQGYRVDDVIPWETWGLGRGERGFRFVCVLFDPGADEVPDGAAIASELRIAFHVRVRRPS